jgi:hypothetical protein
MTKKPTLRAPHEIVANQRKQNVWKHKKWSHEIMVENTNQSIPNNIVMDLNFSDIHYK